MTRVLAAADARARAAARYRTFLDDLATLVNIDSGSLNAAGVNRIADFVQDRARRSGCRVERIPGAPHARSILGDRVVVRRSGRGTARILLLAHMDTVFSDGTAASRPYRAFDGRAYGPGVCDDKAGLLAGLTVLELLADADAETYGEVVLFCTPDEEIGSPTSRDDTARLAADADAVLSLECAREDGSLVSTRKGIVDVTVSVSGRAAHPGVDFERGANAVVAAAMLAADAHRLNGQLPGVRVNVGRLYGGERANVVPSSATVQLEVRVDPEPGLDAALAHVRAIADTVYVPGTVALMTVSGACPPLRSEPGQSALLAHARTVAHELGFQIQDVASGGAADANYAAAAGTPTLDGLGPIGGDDHSVDEWLDLESVVPRVAMLACLISRIAASTVGCVGAINHPTTEGPAT
ncbi:M20/M25/M40 family metallo-hydrolase [Mycolicibacterium hodleri]|uniref:M20/M25/M40 family metallo-hydrolase n=1 Tax=Mycolicibacterium hodleri TaxID=49897 RepID=UPI0019606173|nr:M20/M25/M40 family metallo-hydrolase [Mycolicibacterium hodleri]